MTGFELLKEEMKKRGCTQQQIESKTTRVVLDILAETGTTFTDAYVVEKEAKEKMDAVLEAAEQKEKYFNEYKRRLGQKTKLFKEEVEAAKQYIESFYKALEECETKEGRDAMRRAQVFVNTVKIETPQNNTAFIDGLARILSFGETGGLTRFEKVVTPQEKKISEV